MRDEQLDRLAVAARNRGLKLVRSRVRSPLKSRFRKVGLEDASGEPVFGMDAKGPKASPEDVEDYLRNLETRDWGASLGSTKQRAKSAKSKPTKKKQERGEQPLPPPRPPKFVAKAKIRGAKPSDSARLAELVRQLDHPIDEQTVRNNLRKLKSLAETPLVAILEGKVVGVAGCHKTITLHRQQPLGRITILVVDEQARGRGVGRALVEAVESWCTRQGCKIIEVTSNDRRAEAHAFYRHMGYERTSIRFAKMV